MIRRSRFWRAVAAVFLLVNIAGGAYAAAEGELLHAGGHAAFFLLGAYFLWRVSPMLHARRIGSVGGSAIADLPADLVDRLTHLQQSIEGLAIEVERIGEGQQFLTRFFTEKGIPRGAGGSGTPQAISG